MSDALYISNNGVFCLQNEKLFTIEHRGVRYGDGLFETMHASGTRVQFFEQHMERLIHGMEVMGMEIPPVLAKGAVMLRDEIARLLQKNRISQGARVRVWVFRRGSGLYAPDDDKVDYVLDTQPLNADVYALNRTGLRIGLYEGVRKPKYNLSNLKTTNSLIYVLAGRYKRQQQLDECLIMNTENNIIETVSANLFIVKNNAVFTPSLQEGCIAGVMRDRIIEIAMSEGYTVFDDCQLTMSDMLTADEVFLTNAIFGIRWVLAFRQKRYYSRSSRKLITRLNEIAFAKTI